MVQNKIESDRRSLQNLSWDSNSQFDQTQLFISLHLIHELTSPQAFALLRDRSLFL